MLSLDEALETGLKLMYSTEEGSLEELERLMNICVEGSREFLATAQRKLQPEVATIEVNTQESLSLNSCQICDQAEASSCNELFKCSGCSLYYHQLCHSPSIESAPDWICQSCSSAAAVMVETEVVPDLVVIEDSPKVTKKRVRIVSSDEETDDGSRVGKTSESGSERPSSKLGEKSVKSEGEKKVKLGKTDDCLFLGSLRLKNKTSLEKRAAEASFSAMLEAGDQRIKSMKKRANDKRKQKPRI